MAFLDKLKSGSISESTKEDNKESKAKKPEGFLQLDVDIFQTAKQIIITAPVSGVDIKDLDIAIENENDVVTIQGKKLLPDLGGDNLKPLRQECHWGSFYRQIILPQEINVSEVEAKLEKGILILILPLLRIQSKGKKKVEITENDEVDKGGEKDPSTGSPRQNSGQAGQAKKGEASKE